MKLSPIILFVYNRPEHTFKVLESLKKNIYADESSLYIYSDAPAANASQSDIDNIKKVRSLIKKEHWCKEVNVIENDENIGIDFQTPFRINQILSSNDKVIVLEDDCVLSSGFLKYMNEVLCLYQNDEKVMHVSGWIPPVRKKLPNNFFASGINYNTGWGTWKRAWSKYNPNVRDLIKKVKQIDRHKFDLDGIANHMAYLEAVSKKELNKQNWDIIWLASVFTNHGLSHLPGKSLVNNIGFDGSGLHCDASTQKYYEHKKIAKKIKVKRIPLAESVQAREVLRNFKLNMHKPTFKDKLRDKLRKEYNTIVNRIMHKMR